MIIPNPGTKSIARTIKVQLHFLEGKLGKVEQLNERGQKCGATWPSLSTKVALARVRVRSMSDSIQPHCLDDEEEF